MTMQAPSPAGTRRQSISGVRRLIEKAHNGGLSPAEAFQLKSALEQIEARVAAVNDRIGHKIVETSAAVRVLGTADAQAVVSF